jgi:hydroxyacylglutathione hydrolase
MGIVTGDFVFVGDLGRPDLLEQAAGLHGVQEPSARQLYSSLPRFTRLQDYLQVWPAHGAGSSCGKALGAVPTTTVGYEKLYNASLGAANDGEDAFVDAILSGQPEPQMYFARMKRDNKMGAPVLGNLPQPRKLTITELARKAGSSECLIVDARLDRSAFMAKHIPGSLYAPMNKSFNAVVGSLVMDETLPLVLIIDADHVDAAVRDLVRIGYDNVAAFVDLETLENYFDEGGEHAAIEEVDISAIDDLRADPDVAIVDARFASEFEVGHVPGAISASYTRLPEYVKDRIPVGKTIVVHCLSGARSAAAAAFLAREGFDVKYVNGLFANYRGAVKGRAHEVVA